MEAAAGTTSCDPQSCLAVDIAQLQDYVAGLNLSALTWNETEPIESQPFGTLASDWSRLLLLQERQSSGTALRENLLRLSRIILAAYFAQEDDTWTTDDYASTNEYEYDFMFSLWLISNCNSMWNHLKFEYKIG